VLNVGCDASGSKARVVSFNKNYDEWRLPLNDNSVTDKNVTDNLVVSLDDNSVTQERKKKKYI